MSQDFFDVEKGYQLDEGAVWLTGTGVPGTGGDTDAVIGGSFYTQENDGDGILWVKISNGTGTSRWKRLATEEFASANGGSTDWKNSVRVATAAALPAYTAAGSGVGKTLTMDAVGILTIDGVNTVLGDSVLVKDEGASDVDHGIYEVTTEGTGGVAAVLTRRTDADENAEMTSGHAVAVEEGTDNADEFYQCITNDPITVDTTPLQYVKVSDADVIQELADIRAFIGKTGPGTELPDYSNSYVVDDNDSLETAIGKLDKHAQDARSLASQTNVTTLTTIDSVSVDEVRAARWLLHVEEVADPTKVRVVEINATHDGHSGADAADTDYTVYAKLKMGAAITGLDWDVTLSGSGAGQLMELTVVSTSAVNVRSIREVLLETNVVP